MKHELSPCAASEDPLGAVPAAVVDARSLKRWSQIEPLYQATGSVYPASKEPRVHLRTPFASQPDINKKLALWVGDLSSLNADAIVHPTSEAMNEPNPLSERIHNRAGPGLRQQIRKEIIECKTGEIRITQGHKLPARYIIHTVGPKYNVRYQTAAENTLHLCYRNVLQKALEMDLRSIGLSVINSVKRNYPPDEGAHIALRTLRRFLEQHGSAIDVVVLCVDGTDVGIYQLLLPLYFPRSKHEEEVATWQLPANVGGPNGEPLYPDRQIRIIDNPQHAALAAGDSVELTSHLEIPVGEHSFSQMHGDLDQQRLLGERPSADPLSDFIIKEMRSKESDCRYERLLRRAKSEDLSEVSGIGCLYQSGVDRYGRPIIIFVGKWFRFSDINLDKALLYLIYLLDPLVKNDYVIAYFHTLTTNANHPSFSWLKEVYNVLPYKYKKNLKAFYIIHPTIWTKMMTWWFTTFMAPAIKQKVYNMSGVEYLYSTISQQQLEIPAYITEYDMVINGLHYAPKPDNLASPP